VIDKQRVKNALIDAAIVAGFTALTSFAIYALVKTANNNSNRNYYPASMNQPALNAPGSVVSASTIRVDRKIDQNFVSFKIFTFLETATTTRAQ